MEYILRFATPSSIFFNLGTPFEPTPPPIKEPPDSPENPAAPVREPDRDPAEPTQI